MGAAEHYKLTDCEIAICCSSNIGEDIHINTVLGILNKAKVPVTAMQAGAQYPDHKETTDKIMARGLAPSPLYKSCSGKHSGMLITAKHMGEDLVTYLDISHPVQQRILKNISEVTETPIAEIEIAEDGCGALVQGIPLRNFAHGLAKMATGIGLEPRRADICKKIMRACILNPQMVAGTGKFCTLLMAASKGRIFAKSGAQGIYAVADMDSGISIISKNLCWTFRVGV